MHWKPRTLHKGIAWHVFDIFRNTSSDYEMVCFLQTPRMASVSLAVVLSISAVALGQFALPLIPVNRAQQGQRAENNLPGGIFPFYDTQNGVRTIAIISRPSFLLAAGSQSILSSPVRTSFSCIGRDYGYFADVENNCEIFHICVPVSYQPYFQAFPRTKLLFLMNFQLEMHANLLSASCALFCWNARITVHASVLTIFHPNERNPRVSFRSPMTLVSSWKPNNTRLFVAMVPSSIKTISSVIT